METDLSIMSPKILKIDQKIQRLIKNKKNMNLNKNY